MTKDNILVEAQRRAEQITAHARAEAENTRGDADEYVIDSLEQLQAELERITNQVNNGINTVKDEQARRASTSAPVSQPVEK